MQLHGALCHGSRFQEAAPRRSVSGSVPRTLALLGLAALLGTSACGRPASAQPSGSGAPVASAPAVQTQPVGTRPVTVWLALTGQLEGSRETDLAANVNGKIVKTLVERGASVSAGQPIALVDTRAASLNLAEARVGAEAAEVAAANAKANCERTRALAERGAISPAELERSDTQCRTSELSLSAARARASLAGQLVGDGVIRAPFAGSIAERFVDVGEFVRSDTRVATVVDLSSLRLKFTIPEVHIAAAQAGAKVRFSVAGYPAKSFEATLRYVGAQVRPTTRDLVAEAVVTQPDVTLRPGMFASVALAAGDSARPVVPRGALLARDGRQLVFVVVDGRLEERIVQTGESLGDEVAITRGLAAGERLVVAPNPELRNGQRVP